MEHSENTCPVCSEHIEIYAVGACDHPICYKCSTRMRVLCEQMYCPICRSNMPQVLLVNKNGKHDSFSSRNWHSFRKCQTFFQDKTIKSKFFELLEHKCRLCKDRPPDRYLQDLTRHMRRDHERFFCDLCVEHLKIFTFERKFYDRRQLAVHRREGDPDDSSYKGHPLCRFCDIRYLDNDELSRHLRKDHYFCHFCDTDGSNQYYSEYPVLMEHFREEHYLCEEGECADAQFTHAFRSEIDLKAHKANTHSKGVKRSFAKQARTLDVEFSIVPRNRPERSYREYSDGRVRGSRYGRDRNYNPRQEQDDPELARAIEASLDQSREKEREDQKSKRKESKPAVKPPEPKAAEKPVEEFKHDLESFPSLSGKSSPNPELPTEPTDLPVSGGSSLAHKLALSERHTVRTAASSEEEFPALGKGTTPTNAAKWVRGGGNVNHSTAKRDFPALGNPVRPNIPNSPKPVTKAKHSQQHSSSVPVPQPVKESKISEADKRDVEDFPGLPTAVRPVSGRKETAAKGAWSVKNADSKNVKGMHSSNDEIVRGKNTAKMSGALTLADLGKALHDDNYMVSNSKSNSSTTKANKNCSESSETQIAGDTLKVKVKASEDKMSKKKKKKSKKKPEVECEDFDGYPESKVEKPEVKVTNEVSEKAPTPANENDFDKENSFTKATNRQQSAPKQRNIDQPWEVTESGKRPWTMVDSLEDFPHLSVGSEDNSTIMKPPPGFGGGALSSPPPGFNSSVKTSRPPPGLSKPVLSNSNNVQSDIINVPNIDINSIPQVYSKPGDFSDRNRNLITEIRSYLNDDADKFNLFKTWSGDFRQNILTAKKYYDQCVTLLGREKFLKMFPELLALLPDISKQQDLLEVHRASEKSVKKGWNTASAFITCSVCQQVLVQRDHTIHMSLHNLESDFPTLSHNDSCKGPGLNAWVKAT